MNKAQEYESFLEALQAIQPSSRRRNSDAFAAAYEEIERQLAGRVPLKAILEAFNTAYSLRVSPNGFRQLLSAERNRRQSSGTMPVCRACGHPLAGDEQETATAEGEIARGASI